MLCVLTIPNVETKQRNEGTTVVTNKNYTLQFQLTFIVTCLPTGTLGFVGASDQLLFMLSETRLVLLVFRLLQLLFVTKLRLFVTSPLLLVTRLLQPTLHVRK